MKKQKIYYCEHIDCKACTETTNKGFKYFETKKGEKHVFDVVDSYTLAFILSGEALVSCNEFNNVRFRANEMVLWPTSADCTWESLTDTSAIVLVGDNDFAPCDRTALKEHAVLWLNTVAKFEGLLIKPRLKDFLHSVKNYIDDNITCPQMHKAKLYELSTIFRAYYSPEELREFFLPSVSHTHEFEHFIMKNYLHMKGVKEFVNLSGMNLSTFNRKFKMHFKESPYQWLIKQKSKHIYHDISTTDRSLTSIAKEYQFSDASHFNRYCKTMFGVPPSAIRKQQEEAKQATPEYR